MTLGWGGAAGGGPAAGTE